MKIQDSKRLNFALRKSTNQGFTILELLVVVVVIGVLGTASAPVWLTFLNNQRLTIAQEQVHHLLQEARRNSIQDKVTWQVSFREQSNVAQWAVHRQSATTNTLSWYNFDSKVRIDDTETTFAESAGVWRVQFNYKGHVNGRLGRLTLMSRQGGKAKRCVITSTLIGAIRTAKERPTQQNGRFCY